MSGNWGKNLQLSIFGESHGAAIGITVNGLPAGMTVDEEFIAKEMARRAPGGKAYATPRREADKVRIVSGVFNGKTTGSPICGIIENSDTHSSDYLKTANLARPGHADYTAFVRYNGANDIRGGGHFSGRLTAPIVFAGALAKMWLAEQGITVGAHLASIGDVCDTAFDALNVNSKCLNELAHMEIPTNDAAAADAMLELIAKYRAEGNSVGGVVECAAVGVPVGWGNPFFGGVESVLSGLLYSIPAVKGVEFGDGFAVASACGKDNNDEMFVQDGKVAFYSNHAGGIYGGITSGAPIIVRTAFKPTPSIYQPQRTVDLNSMENAELQIQGRHDPCIVPRALCAVEAMVAIGLAEIGLGVK